jgi:hypothetical protein
MKNCLALIVLFCAAAALGCGQDKFTVSGTPIPNTLAVANYGPMPKGVTGYDVNICNATGQKLSLVSSQIYQSLSQTNLALKPLGRQIMLTAILQNQRRSVASILDIAFNSATGIVALLSASGQTNIPNGFKTSVGLGSIVLGQVTSQLKPVLPPDKVEKFDREVLEPALVLDGGSCVERTIFALSDDPKSAPASLSFHIR